MRTERKSFFCYIVQLFASEEDPQGLKMDAKISLLGGPEESFCVGGGPGPIHRGGGGSALLKYFSFYGTFTTSLSSSLFESFKGLESSTM